MIDVTLGALVICTLLTISVEIRTETALSIFGILLNHAFIANIFVTTLDAIRIVILAELAGISILIVSECALQTGINGTADTLTVESSTIKTFPIL